jgi:hypothetical protein
MSERARLQVRLSLLKTPFSVDDGPQPFSAEIAANQAAKDCEMVSVNVKSGFSIVYILNSQWDGLVRTLHPISTFHEGKWMNLLHCWCSFGLLCFWIVI